MAANNKVVLFDLPSKPPCKTWSLNPWKTRLFLNYKNIPYETRWIEYPDINAELSPHMHANGDGSWAPYTIPTVILPDGTYMQESLAIAKKLDQVFPNGPASKIDTHYLDKVAGLIEQCQAIVAPEFLYLIPQRILNEKSAVWWYPDRERRVGGQKLEDLRREKGGDKAAKAVAAVVANVTALLEQHPEGPFFEGETVTYADFVWVGWLKFMLAIGDDMFDLALGPADREAHLVLLRACKPWLERDDH